MENQINNSNEVFGRVLLFAGTTEGREVADFLINKGIETYCCVATKSGEEVLPVHNLLKVSVRRLETKDMEELIERLRPELIIDASHPYATLVSNNIYDAATNKDCKLIRVIRDIEELVSYDKAVYFDDAKTLVDWLNESQNIHRKIFSTLGAKEAHILSNVWNCGERIKLRILPAEESKTLCLSAGFTDENIVAKMPPFSIEDNRAMFAGSDIMITKDTGKTGGFSEKIEAAIELGLIIGIIRRPVENQKVIKMDIKEIKEYIQRL